MSAVSDLMSWMILHVNQYLRRFVIGALVPSILKYLLIM